MANKWGLTSKEEEVLSLMARGYSTPGVANKLSISLCTAKSHISTIYGKLNLSTSNKDINLHTTAVLMYLFRNK